jgi:hypothetical protein
MANTKINTDVINDNAITTSKIANDAITNAKLAANSVNAEQLNVSGNGASGQYLQSDGDGSMTWSTVANSYAGNKVAAYSTPGTYTWTVPSGVTSAMVVCYGAGGGGQPGYGAGRGGAGLVHVTNLTPNSGVSVNVGLGGQYGSAGGSSAFGSWITANGGSGSGNNPTNGNSTSGNGAIPYQIGRNILEKSTFPWVDQNRGDRPSTSANTTRVNFSWTNGWLPGAGGQYSGTNYFQGVGGVGGLVLIYY